jgi:hypothetical protein
MKTLVARMALATAAALVAQLAVEAANAQSYGDYRDYRSQRRPQATQRSYDSSRDRPSGSRFTPEEQKIIDQITERGWQFR